jgi:hypothetical protein
MKITYWKLNPDHSLEPAPLNDQGRPTDEYIEWLYGEDSYKHKVLIQEEVGNKWVSTVFLGLDHGFGDNIRVFETMVFTNGEGSERDCQRYSTWEEAIAGHRRVCDELTSGLSREQLEAARALIEPLLKGS